MSQISQLLERVDAELIAQTLPYQSILLELHEIDERTPDSSGISSSQEACVAKMLDVTKIGVLIQSPPNSTGHREGHCLTYSLQDHRYHELGHPSDAVMDTMYNKGYPEVLGDFAFISPDKRKALPHVVATAR